MTRRLFPAYVFLLLLVAANTGLWYQARHWKSVWLNVPPAPGQDSVKGMGLGDPELAFRSICLMLQNLGDMGGRVTPLKDYDYPMLGQWFNLADKLDSQSRFVPLIAALYYGASQDPSKLGPVIDYLIIAGQRPGPMNFQWLMQAMYLARFRMNDMNRAMIAANDLAVIWKPGMPLWAKQAPAFIMTANGDKKDAYALMLNILKTEAGKVPQAELNSTIIFMCTRTLDPAEAQNNPVCRSVPASWLALPKSP